MSSRVPTEGMAVGRSAHTMAAAELTQHLMKLSVRVFRFIWLMG